MKTVFIFLPACMLLLALNGAGGQQPGHFKMEEQEKTSLINPATFDFSQAVAAEQLRQSIMFFYETEFQFLVYPYNDKIIAYAQAYSGPDGADLSLDFRLLESQEKKLAANTPVIIKGKIEGANYGRINVYDAVIVSEGITPTVNTFDINSHDSTKVYNARELFAVLSQWESKSVTITGLYQGFTQSTSTEGKVLERRVDVGADGAHVIGCAFKDDPAVGDQLSAGADRVTIKGTISWELSYGNPYMRDCAVVK